MVENRFQRLRIACCLNDGIERCDLLEILFCSNATPIQMRQTVGISIKNHDVMPPMGQCQRCKMTDGSGPDHGAAGRLLTGHGCSQTSKAFQYDGERLTKNRLHKTDRSRQSVNEACRSDHVLRISAVPADDSVFCARRTANRIPLMAGVAFAATLDALHDHRIVFRQFCNSRTFSDYCSRKFVPGNDWVFGHSRLEVAQLTFEYFKIRGADTFISHSHQHLSGL